MLREQTATSYTGMWSAPILNESSAKKKVVVGLIAIFAIVISQGIVQGQSTAGWPTVLTSIVSNISPVIGIVAIIAMFLIVVRLAGGFGGGGAGGGL